MPLYEYRCRKCGTQIEKIQKFSDPPLDTCESCGGALERLLSSAAIQFKGSGWYVTDYAHKPSAPGSPSSSDGGKTSTPSGGESKKTPEPSSAKTSTDSKS